MEKSPDAFRTISEAADELDLPQHVLRFWETKFSTIKPMKRGGGRRYYRTEDVLLLKGIRNLLYEQGFTIRGVQKILRDHGARHVIIIGNGGSAAELAALPEPEADAPEQIVDAQDDAGQMTPRSGLALSGEAKERLSAVLRDLLDCKRLLERARE
jgi:DNA-binding transcriptional MerR regulator